MTHDAHLFFEDASTCQTAAEILKGVQIDGQRLFFVETYLDAPTKLFYRIDFTDNVAEDAELVVCNQKLRFFDFYKGIVERTGKHIPFGTLFCNIEGNLPKIKNHEIFSAILEFFYLIPNGIKTLSY
jgi:hypothetical protein